LDLSMSHLKAKRHGTVTGTAILRKGGRQVHVWDIEIKDEAGELISVGRMSALVQQPKSK
jgi:1,4-dihydroxy-2-naphthoyl-CoA hydrolase